ncbi:lysosomal acid glucosylceramidase-like [Anthonomus grandis grandis]|uniref:lysosomal acid glucosylceramidase-like n=1 Tax=Anthonomus grandis grandis TaxID=2921223 RepID=UPI0021658090|nr:lysosomal acid glucosylceramidase-like [Anthonomus grandis grandis]
MCKPLIIILFFLYLHLVKCDKLCQKRLTSDGSICVCNSSYCDTVPHLVKDMKPGKYQLYSTSKESIGFTSTLGNFLNKDEHQTDIDNVLTIKNLVTLNQTIIGFGGAFTDSAGINILKLSKRVQEQLLQSYFGDEGVQYSVCRIPMGGTDFSIRGYTYCDQCNESLDGFTLQEEDIKFKIPLIQKATKIRGRNNIKYFASAWTAPTWMKTSGTLTGKGTIKEKYLDLWAQYYLKFVEAYRDHDINIWGITTQNEPVNGVVGSKIPANGFTSGQMIKWIRDALGPAVRNSSFKDLKIMLHDEQRILLPVLNLFILSDSKVLEYADGIAVHWYTDFIAPAATLLLSTSDKKNLFRLASEACAGYREEEQPVVLGSWERAEEYLNSIMDDLRYGLSGWVDWNIALDEEGGPNYVNNNVDSPIIINSTADEFYKQPMFYALGHFSKFLISNSIRIDVEVFGKDLDSLGFLRPDGKVALIIRNRSENRKKIQLNALEFVGSFTVDAHSINTVIFVPK